MQDSNRVRPSVEKQGSAHANGLLAQCQLEMGHLEAACATWGKFLDDYETLSSSRADEHFEIMRRRLRPHMSNPYARELSERARELARQKSAVQGRLREPRTDDPLIPERRAGLQDRRRWSLVATARRSRISTLPRAT